MPRATPWGWWSVLVPTAQMIDARVPCQAEWNRLKHTSRGSAPSVLPSTRPSCGCKGGLEKWAGNVTSTADRTPKTPQHAEKESSARARCPAGRASVRKRDTVDTMTLASERNLGILRVLETIRQQRDPTLAPHQFTSASTHLNWHRGATRVYFPWEIWITKLTMSTDVISVEC